MAATLTPADTFAPEQERVQARPSGGGPVQPRPPEDGGDGSSGPDPGSLAVQRYKLGMWIAMGGIVMLFAAFTSAMVVRKGLSDDWMVIDLPGVLWLSTAVLILSSFSLELARRSMRQGLNGKLRQWVSLTGFLGLVFVATQLFAWGQLRDRGIYVATNPSSSFFYLLTAAHGLHVLGGILAMSYVVIRVWRRSMWVTREATVEATTLYWHFMDGLWIYLFVLLMVWR